MIFRDICLGLLGLTASACGIFMTLKAAMAVGNAIRSLGWAQVLGRADQSTVGTRTGPRAGDQLAATYYRPAIHYSYEVGGVSYQSRRIWFLEFGASSPRWALKAAQLVGSDGSVKVYYDPAAPARAVLDRGIPLPIVALGFAGLLFLTSAGGIAAFFVWAARHGTL
jgi:hypothetical protein